MINLKYPRNKLDINNKLRLRLYLSNFESSKYDLKYLINIKDPNLSEYRKNLLSIVNTTELFGANTGDFEDEISPPYLIGKNRGYKNTTSGYIIYSYDWNRHWGNFYERPRDILWEDKKDEVFWRGVLTGKINKPGSRYKLIKNNFNKHKKIHIALKRPGNTFKQDLGEEKAIILRKNRRWIKPKVPIETFLKYKYLISVEGNDKDSGLNWKLNSNSLVLMCKPTYTSWLLETQLEPWVHYVPLNEEYTDLLEKFEWCKKNQIKCKQIVRNANKYMEQFGDIENEKMLERMVCENYRKNFELNKSKFM